MNRKYKTLSAMVSILVLLDQATKLYVDSNMALYESIDVITNFFQITYIRNSGAAFGIFSGIKSPWMTFFFLSISLTAIGIILYCFHKTDKDRLLALTSYGLIVSGAIGNFIDRVFHGEVIDFLYFHWYKYYWPAFNVADSCITIGVGLLMWEMIFSKSIFGENNDLNLSNEK